MKDYIKQCINAGGREIIEAFHDGQRIIREYSLQDGFYLCLKLDYEKNHEEDVFMIPAMTIQVNIENAQEEAVTDTFRIRNASDPDFTALYMAKMLEKLKEEAGKVRSNKL